MSSESVPADEALNTAEGARPQESSGKPRHRMSTRQRLLFFLTAWLIVLMPFLFWWNTWFGRPLSDKQLTEYLNDEKHPRHIQHALIQIGERMGRNDAAVSRWFPELVRLASNPVEEVRKTDAWVMGQDNSVPYFRVALLKMLNDSSVMVRGNAALSLVRFGDSSGRPQLVALLQPVTVRAPEAGTVVDAGKAGTAIRQNGLIVKLKADGQTTEVRSPITGRIRSAFVQAGANVGAGTEMAIVAPETEQVWEALRGLYLVGQLEDLPAITPYERDLPDIPVRLRQQAILTDQAVRQRAAKPGANP
jgi:Biotin-requiring enzyme